MTPAQNRRERRQIIRCLQDCIFVLKDNFTNRIGPDKGKITVPAIVEEIRLHRRAIELIKAIK